MIIKSNVRHNVGFRIKGAAFTVVGESKLNLDDEIWKKFRDLPSVKTALKQGALVIVRDVELTEEEIAAEEELQLEQARALVANADAKETEEESEEAEEVSEEESEEEPEESVLDKIGG